MDSELQSLKQHPRVLDLYRSRLSLKQDGRRWRGPCPFHNDKHATNFDVFPDGQTYIFKCLSCGKAGSVLDLVQQTDNVDFKHAVKIVREFCSEWSDARKQVSSTFKSLSEEKPVEKKVYQEAEYKKLEEALKNSKAGQEFLAGRGIGMEVARKLRLGYRQDVGRLAGDLVGVEVAAGGWIVFPTFANTASERVVTSLKYRSARGKFFCKSPGMSTELFNADDIDCLEPVFLTEGECDTAIICQAGFHAVSLPNATTVKPEWKDKLLEAEYVVLAGDNDAAGNKVRSQDHCPVP